MLYCEPCFGAGQNAALNGCAWRQVLDVWQILVEAVLMGCFLGRFAAEFVDDHNTVTMSDISFPWQESKASRGLLDCTQSVPSAPSNQMQQTRRTHTP